MRSTIPRFLPPLVAAALLLTSCSAGGLDDPAPTEPTPGAVGDEQISPLDPYYDILYGRVSDVEFSEEFTASEDLIAACMAAEGFDYIPRGEAYLRADRELQQSRPGDREWVAENGYGITASMAERRAAVDAADPNSDYVAQLPPGELEAYLRALSGDQNSGGDDTGCTGEAAAEEGPPSLSERWAPLTDALDQMWADVIPADPEWVRAQSDWSGCMADVGYPGLRTPEDGPAAIAGGNGAEAGAGGAVDGSETTSADEIDIALADFDCRVQTDHEERVRKVTHAAEATFLERNRDQLETLVAEYEQNR